MVLVQFELKELLMSDKEKVICYVTLKKKDILDYLDFNKVAQYLDFSLKNYNLDIYDFQLKTILEKECKELYPNAVEYLASTMKNLDSEFEIIIEILKKVIKS